MEHFCVDGAHIVVHKHYRVSIDHRVRPSIGACSLPGRSGNKGICPHASIVKMNWLVASC